MFTLEINKTCTLGGDSDFFAPLVREFCLVAKCYSFNCFITVIPMGTVHNISPEKVNLINCGEVITKAAAFRGSVIINSVQVCCQSPTELSTVLPAKSDSDIMFRYKDIRNLESMDHLCTNPFLRIGLIHK